MRRDLPIGPAAQLADVGLPVNLRAVVRFVGYSHLTVAPCLVNGVHAARRAALVSRIRA
jgi:hypothetical protein